MRHFQAIERHERIVSLALVLLAACQGSSTAPDLPPSRDHGRSCSALPLDLIGLSSIGASLEWATWYSQAESCAGKPSEFSRVRWYTVERVDELDGTATNIIGVTCVDDIYLVSTAEANVRHEILHHLLGVQGHPSEFFTRCAEDLVGSP